MAFLSQVVPALAAAAPGVATGLNLEYRPLWFGNAVAAVGTFAAAFFVGG